MAERFPCVVIDGSALERHLGRPPKIDDLRALIREVGTVAYLDHRAGFYIYLPDTPNHAELARIVFRHPGYVPFLTRDDLAHAMIDQIARNGYAYNRMVIVSDHQSLIHTASLLRDAGRDVRLLLWKHGLTKEQIHSLPEGTVIELGG